MWISEQESALQDDFDFHPIEKPVARRLPRSSLAEFFPLLPRSLPYPVISPETKRRDSGDRQRKAGKEGMSKNCCHSSGRPTDRLLDAARRNRRGTRNAKRVTGRGGYIFHSPCYLSSAFEAQELRCSEILGSLAPCSIRHKTPSKPQSDECRRASQNFAGDSHSLLRVAALLHMLFLSGSNANEITSK